jgi:spermidine/putrescine transport system permease protein
MAVVAPARQAPLTLAPPPARRKWLNAISWRNPWRKPLVLGSVVWLYLIWSIAPIALAILFSFNAGKSQSVWQGFSTQWYVGNSSSVWGDPSLHQAFWQTIRLAGYTTLVATPVGVLFAIGVSRWLSRWAKALNFVMIFSFVMPELIFAFALFFVFTQLFSFIHLGTLAQFLALVVWNISWSAIIVAARLVSIGSDYEEAAADLGASRFESLRRVLFPLLYPAIFVSAVLIFAGVIDDFVMVDFLSSTGPTQTMAVAIYSSTRGGANGPALNALATIMLGLSLVVIVLGYFAYRIMTRGERGASSHDALKTIGGM